MHYFHIFFALSRPFDGHLSFSPQKILKISKIFLDKCFSDNIIICENYFKSKLVPARREIWPLRKRN
ncbi:MAG: hypothetical protein AMS15_01980 [Planctomycetes bacterium DG_23]|nr:MAG: hypothetical protein AMS15_01980 [Planctomycetes bacterium DG_23]